MIRLGALLLVICNFAIAQQEPFRVLHLTFHKGCAQEIQEVAQVLGFEVETWFIPDLPALFFDGISQGNVLYNMGHERADRIFKLHKSTFDQFDVIMTSDTAPLARIFLQNGFTKPLIVWVCNRFDYSDQASLDCPFPDAEFYQLFQKASQIQNVKVVAYTLFEHEYALKNGVDTGDLVITPCAPITKRLASGSLIPHTINKKDTFFLPPYSNEELFFNKCSELTTPIYCGRYNGAADLSDFKGIIHFPYAWSNLALFENISEGIPYFIPSISFLKTLLQDDQYWFVNREYLVERELFELSEWYQPGREEIITYFDSWEDLQYKIDTVDFSLLRRRIKKYAESHRLTILDKWSQLFNEFSFITSRK
ncbi:MAG: hypothetical protein KBC64_01490 [Simkaniaceae bacterium]|nr:hypothetical protein [Simkaniaceae bacterium]